MVSKMMKRFAPLLTVLALAACENDGGVEPGTSRVSIKLTDAPGDLKEAWVEITKIYLAGEGETGQVVLREGSTGMVDLLTLAGGKTADLVENATVSSGTYSQLRFVIGSAYLVTNEDKVYATQGAKLPAGLQATGSLKCPSCAQSGLKVNLPGGAVNIDGETTIVVVDFDVSQSFGKAAGQSGQWVMRPVMHASGFTTSGSIGGTVALADTTVKLPATCGGQAIDLTKFVPRATAGETVKSGVTTTAGAYKISFVAPANYTLGVAPVAFENQDTLFVTAAATPAEVTVESGKTATADYKISAATCKVKA